MVVERRSVGLRHRWGRIYGVKRLRAAILSAPMPGKLSMMVVEEAGNYVLANVEREGEASAEPDALEAMPSALLPLLTQ